jgi:hypothetical protein
MSYTTEVFKDLFVLNEEENHYREQRKKETKNERRGKFQLLLFTPLNSKFNLSPHW